MKRIVNLSGGKDSTAMLLMMLENDIAIDYIVFADTGKDFPQMLLHLEKLEAYIAARYPFAPKITRLKAEKTFDYLMFEHEKNKRETKRSIRLWLGNNACSLVYGAVKRGGYQ